VGLSSPLPCPQTARPSGCKGARNAREPATNPCGATGASGSHLRSLASHGKLGKSGANRKCGPEARMVDGLSTPACAQDFPSPRTVSVFPSSWAVRIQPELTLGSGGQSKIGNGAVKECQRTRLPSGGSPLAVLRVNLGHEYWPQRELSLPSLPRQFAQISAC
jgi:hypothetical protein